MTTARRVAHIAAAGVLAALLAVGQRDSSDAAPARLLFANAADPTLVTLGKQVYMAYCASCHGRALQGQPLWQLADQFAGRRAPAHDETGHTWQHSDEELFRVIKEGRFPSQAADAASAMPAFAAKLDDRRILAAAAFIKSRWPIGLRVAQALLNPDRAGMPANAQDVEWRFPPTCNALRRPSASAAPVRGPGPGQ